MKLKEIDGESLDLSQKGNKSGWAEEILTRTVAFHAHFSERGRHQYGMASMRDVYDLLGQTRASATM